MSKRICSIEDCGKPVKTRGWCNSHYKRYLRWGDPQGGYRERGLPCDVDGCNLPHNRFGYCRMHAERVRKYGHPGPAHRVINKRGEGTVGKDGYRKIWVDGQLVREHRYVMEQALGRPLFPDENVHHINGDRADNRLENLELWSTSQPSGQRVEDKVEWAQMILTRYGHLESTQAT